MPGIHARIPVLLLVLSLPGLAHAADILTIYQEAFFGDPELRAAAANRDAVKTMAIRAYQSVLDNFPDSVSFDATGTVSFRLATPAYKAIVARGGKVEGDWVLVTTPDGRDEAVQGGRDLKKPPLER